MICNVCEKDGRCYSLIEQSFGPPRPIGLMFNICTDCLIRLIEPIASDKSTVENEADFPVPEHFERRRERMLDGRTGVPGVEKKPIKVKKP